MRGASHPFWTSGARVNSEHSPDSGHIVVYAAHPGQSAVNQQLWNETLQNEHWKA